MSVFSSRKEWHVQKQFHPRKAHTKSRSGCQACKVAKVKCSEERPICHRCSTRRGSCRYEGGFDDQPTSMCGTVVLARNITPLPVALSPADLESWYHFTTVTWDTLADPLVNAVIRENLGLVFHHEYLRHAILALAASHQRFLRSTDLPNSLAERHLGKAVALFRSQLMSPPKPSTMDAVLLTAYVLNTQNFFLHQLELSSSWSTECGVGLGWLTLLRGWRALLLQHSCWLSTSFWVKTMQQTTPPPHFLRSSSKPTSSMLSSLPSAWKTAFGTTDDVELDTNPYVNALHRLAAFTTDEERTCFLRPLMTFVHRLEPELLHLLNNREPLAVCIIAIWLGYLCRVDLWWVARRARLECYAACEYVEIHAPDTARLLLDGTARACGYIEQS